MQFIDKSFSGYKRIGVTKNVIGLIILLSLPSR